MTLKLPFLPPESVYTKYYCEENIYLLCQTFLYDQTLKDSWEVFVVFISNERKTVALRYQKAARVEGESVVWDYHVILVLRRRTAGKIVSTSQSWVYDFDTCLPIPCQWQYYLDMTFASNLLPEYQSMFRVILGEDFIQNFASDRSHMLTDVGAHDLFDGDLETGQHRDPVYSSPPPIYPSICGPSALQRGITNNLMENFVSIVDKGASIANCYGTVFDSTEEVDSFF